jgi:Ca2+/Na+ antiporter
MTELVPIICNYGFKNGKFTSLDIYSNLKTNENRQTFNIMKQTNYFLLAGLFFVVFLVMEFTEIYGDSGWFKAFLIILFVTFLISGIANRKKKNNDSEQT